MPTPAYMLGLAACVQFRTVLHADCRFSENTAGASYSDEVLKVNHQLRDDVLVLGHVAIGANFAGRLHWVRRDKAGMAAHTAISFLLGRRIIAHGSTSLADGSVKALHPDLCQAGTLAYVHLVFHRSPPPHKRRWIERTE